MQHSATKTRCYLFVGFSLGSLLNPISTQTLVKNHNCMYKLLENFNHFIESVKKEKPDTIKGEIIKGTFLTSTMGISYKIGAK